MWQGPLRLGSVVGVAWLTAAALVAQAPTNFSGVWVADASARRTGATASAMVTAGGGTWSPVDRAVEERVAQTTATLTIERRSSGSRQKFVYKLDGTDSVNVNGRATRRTKSRWEGEVIVTEGQESTSTARDAIVTAFREVRSIDNAGTMVVETTRKFEGTGQTVHVLALVKKK